MKILLVVVWEKNSFGAIWPCQPLGHFFTVLLGLVKLSQATVNWILKQSVQDFFHDYDWILNGKDMISQVNIYVVDIV